MWRNVSQICQKVEIGVIGLKQVISRALCLFFLGVLGGLLEAASLVPPTFRASWSVNSSHAMSSHSDAPASLFNLIRSTQTVCVSPQAKSSRSEDVIRSAGFILPLPQNIQAPQMRIRTSMEAGKGLTLPTPEVTPEEKEITAPLHHTPPILDDSHGSETLGSFPRN